MKDSDDLINEKIISHGGKSTVKYSSWFNVKNTDTNDQICIDFKNHVSNWENVSPESVNVSLDSSYSVSFSKQDIINAKLKELELWKTFNVYNIVPNTGQKLISTRWVLTEKTVDDMKVAKARLVIRGFDEYNLQQSDSPTTSKDTLRIFLALFNESTTTNPSVPMKD